MQFKRKIRLFFVDYGRLLFIVIAIIAAIIYGIQSLNNYAKEKSKNKQTFITEEQKNIIKQQQREISDNKKFISKFIDYCNEGNYEQAYNMLSEKCKKEKYVTLQDFRNNYINNYFKIKIDKYEINKSSESYDVILTQDMLVTGKTNSKLQTKISVDNLDSKIYIYN